MIQPEQYRRDGYLKGAGCTTGAALLFLAFVLPAPWTSSDALAQQAAAGAGRSLAATCANCHGTDGRSVGGFTALAGYPAERMVTAMAEFKNGSRPATIMHQIAKGYSDEQIATLAAYFATQRK